MHKIMIIFKIKKFFFLIKESFSFKEINIFDLDIMSLIKGKFCGLLYSYYPIICVSGEKYFKNFIEDENEKYDEKFFKNQLLMRNMYTDGSRGNFFTKEEIKSNMEEFKNEFEELKKEGTLIGFLNPYSDLQIKIERTICNVTTDVDCILRVPSPSFSSEWINLKSYGIKIKTTVPDESRQKFFNWRVYIKINDDSDDEVDEVDED